MSTLSGKAWVFGDDISTDHIAPGRYFHLRSDLPEMAKHVLEDSREDFAEKVQPGDFVVAGENFGLGSSREHAPAIIKLAGVSAVLAKSFARIFFRNAVNIGLPAIMVDTSGIGEGDQIEVDLEKGLLKNQNSGKQISFQPLSEEMMGILKDGGLVEHVRKHGEIRL
jgi:3-isopropylmalate/(R)-2-methylmalate dehydratase small subunit